MATALFHKNPAVYVKPVGTWALIERVLPQWVKGMDEPLRVMWALVATSQPLSFRAKSR